MTFIGDYMLDPPAEGYRCGCRNCRSDPFVCSGVRRIEHGRNIFVSGGEHCHCECHSEWWDDVGDQEFAEPESPYIVTERDKAEFMQMLDDYEASIAIPPSPSDLLRERVSRADWSLFDSCADDDRAIAPRGRVVRAGLVALLIAGLASLGVLAATGGFK